MIDKLKKAIKKSKTKLMVVGILWLVLAIVFVAPMSISIKAAEEGDVFHFGTFLENLYSAMGKLGTSILAAFSFENIGYYFGVLWKFTVIYLIEMFFLLLVHL